MGDASVDSIFLRVGVGVGVCVSMKLIACGVKHP